MSDTAVQPEHGQGSPDSEFDELFSIPEMDRSPVDGPTLEEGDSPGMLSLPFMSVYEEPTKDSVFIPGEDIIVKIIDLERQFTSHLLNPNLYTIELRHGGFSWTVKKRYNQFLHLHQQLKLFRTRLAIPFASRVHLMAGDGKPKARGSPMGPLPRFPKKPEALVLHEDINQRMEQLQLYLTNLLAIRLYRHHPETMTFLEVSRLSFIVDLGEKGKEGVVLKRSGSTRPGFAGINICGLLSCGMCLRCNYVCSDLCGKWRQRWLILKDTFLCYLRPRDASIRCVMLFDGSSEVSSAMFAAVIQNGLHILNHSRQLVIKCWTRRKSKDWLSAIKSVMCNEAKDFTQKNRYNSYAPERLGTEAAWFVDGSAYMCAVADALEAATEEIYIADWWLSPEIYMKRPSLCGDTWRLDTILKRKAEQGVKVFVLLYKEVKEALGINSYYSKQQLTSLHPNIKVLRHPDHVKSGVLFWAHHEKIVVIDQTYAFVGGIDLCYGRWDDHHHRLTDLGSVSQPTHQLLPPRRKQTSSRPTGESHYPQSLLHLAVATNTVTLGALGGSHTSLLSTELESIRISVPRQVPESHPHPQPVRLPEHPGPEGTSDLCNPDENAKCNTPEAERRNLTDRVWEKTESARSLGRSWMSWLYTSSDAGTDGEAMPEGEGKVEEEGEKSVEPSPPSKAKEAGGKDEDYLKDTRRNMGEDANGSYCSNRSSMVEGLSGMAKLWIGKDYANFIVKDFQKLELPYQDMIDRITTPRMPWHDVGVMVQGAAARDVARHFIQRWNATKLEKANLSPFYPYLLPKSYKQLEANMPSPLPDISMQRVDCQVVRSISQWSAGYLDPETWEEGIHEAYLEVITQAQHYVYIENQFFITLALHNGAVHNQIGEVLFKRIARAHREKATFRVYVVMPLLPGFEGEVGSPSGMSLHAITHWNYSSICKGKDAIVNRLKDAGVTDPSEYISFYGLRKHSNLDGNLVSELIYVHSKLLIADDKVVICGSANINDRSMVGKRDSEIAVVLRDQEFDDGLMGGQPFPTGRLAGSLRRYLFREHLGLLDIATDFDVADPVCESFYRDIWMKVAAMNMRIYEEVFRCIPSDQATSFHKLKKFQDELSLSIRDPVEAAKLLEGVQGHVVSLPLDFLKNENLTQSLGGTMEVIMEGIIPTCLWT